MVDQRKKKRCLYSHVKTHGLVDDAGIYRKGNVGVMNGEQVVQ